VKITPMAVLVMAALIAGVALHRAPAAADQTASGVIRLAQLSGADRQAFIKSSRESCISTTQRNHPNINAQARETYCGCMAEKAADVTTPDDFAYFDKHQEMPPDYSNRLAKLADACNAAVGLH
jgi:hypothetical protein